MVHGVWEFPKIRGLLLAANSGALITRTPRKWTPKLKKRPINHAEDQIQRQVGVGNLLQPLQKAQLEGIGFGA